MAVETNASAIQNIVYATPPSGSVGLTTSSFVIQFYRNTPSAYSELFYLLPSGGVGGSNECLIFLLDYGNAAYDAGKVTFLSWNFSTGAGEWYSTSDFLVLGENQIGITYDSSLTSNIPILYHNGSTVPLTARATPTGVLQVGIDTDIYVGSAATNSPKIILRQFLRYNVILSASEIADAYASRLSIPTRRGLVFAPQLHSRGEVGEGGTLTASQTIADCVSGSLGTPSGSPLFKQDSFLTF